MSIILAAAPSTVLSTILTAALTTLFVFSVIPQAVPSGMYLPTSRLKRRDGDLLSAAFLVAVSLSLIHI